MSRVICEKRSTLCPALRSLGSKRSSSSNFPDALKISSLRQILYSPTNRYGWLQHFLSCIVRFCKLLDFPEPAIKFTLLKKCKVFLFQKLVDLIDKRLEYSQHATKRVLVHTLTCKYAMEFIYRRKCIAVKSIHNKYTGYKS